MKTQSKAVFVLQCFLAVAGTHCFTPTRLSQASGHVKTSDQSLRMGFFDNIKLIFSDEGKANRAAYDEQKRDEQEALQREILMRRANPEAMNDYQNDVVKRRNDLTDERELWKFQQENSSTDPMETWNKLREEGKIKVGSDLPRDPDSSRLGSEGLQEVRIDERMPYIDQGYVEEQTDKKGGIMNIFGKKKEDDDSE